MKTIEAVELFTVLKDLKLSGMDTSDRLKVIRNLRALREVADKYSVDMDLAKERLKPDDYDSLVMKMLESNEPVVAVQYRIWRLRHLTSKMNSLTGI